MSDGDIIIPYMRKLERLAGEMGVDVDGKQPDEEEVDTSNMTKYEKNRFAVTKTMKGVRDDLKVLEEIEKGKTNASAARKAELSNKIRKNLRSMKLDAANLKKDAAGEGKLEEYDELIKHMKRTEKLHSNRFRQKEIGDSLEEGGFDSGGAVPMKSLSQLEGDQGDLSEGLLDPAEDEEFQQFYQQTRENDQKIEQGLTNISAGLTRLKQNALNMGDIIEQQNEMLDRINDKADGVTRQIHGLNKKLKKTLKEVEKDKYCMYVICCLLLLGIIGVVVSQTGMAK
eukprot:TRINITY_DN2733_c0_g1_i1.p1 TRINITY_DN2733_c0_g1~~TRINITY_DN2733_c0_g1_i1.p1  ORF type:complete len:310 (+),score=77.24 TRINITY_DN2733_c0_g1_i1:80-931(+)